MLYRFFLQSDIDCFVHNIYCLYNDNLFGFDHSYSMLLMEEEKKQLWSACKNLSVLKNTPKHSNIFILQLIYQTGDRNFLEELVYYKHRIIIGMTLEVYEHCLLYLIEDNLNVFPWWMSVLPQKTPVIWGDECSLKVPLSWSVEHRTTYEHK